MESLCSEEYDRHQYPAAELRTLSHHRPVLLAAAAGPGRLGDFNARFRHGKFCQQTYYYMLRKKYVCMHVKKYFIYLQIAFFCEDRKVLDLIGVFLSGSDIID